MAEDQNSLPTWDEAMQGGDKQSLPTWDDALKQNPVTNTQAVGSFLGALWNDDASQEGMAKRSAALQLSSVGRIIDKMGFDTAESVRNIFDPANTQDGLGFSPEQIDSVNKHFEESQSPISKGIFNGVVVPAAGVADAAMKALAVPFTAVSSGAAQTAEELQRVPVVGKALAFPFGALGELAAEPQGLVGIHLPPEVTTARANNVIGAGVDEGVYMGTKPAPPDALVGQQEAARQSAAYEAPEELPPVKAPDIHEVARNIAPETFNEYDRLATTKETLRSSLDFLNEQRSTEAETSAPHNDEIKELQEKLEDANARKTKIYQEKIDQLTEANNATIEEAKAKDTPEMAQIRQRLQDIDYRMRDLAPNVSSAYRTAQEFAPREEAEKGDVEQAQKIAQPEPAKVDRTHDVPYLAGSNEKGGVTYIDKRVPQSLDIGGKTVDPAKYLVVHEQTEHALMTKEGLSYEEAHKKATAAEKAAVEADGVDWQKYQETLKPYIQKTEHEKAEHPPADLYTKPYPHKEANFLEKEGKKAAPEEIHGRITNDVAKKLVALGRPLEEAKASAELVGRFFRTMSEIYGGKKGTAEDFYAKEGANIIRGKLKAKQLAQGDLNQFATAEDEAYAKKQGLLANLEDQIHKETNPDKLADLKRERDLVSKWLDEHPRELSQTSKGNITLATDAAKATIRLMKTADASTFVHESAHHFLDIMARYSKEEDAPQRLKDDVATIRKWLGPKEGTFGGFTKLQHESFARAFERYLMEGTAPSKELAGIFEKFKKWLTDIYKTVSNIPDQKIQITDDIRDVFNRLLSNEKKEEPVIAPERVKEPKGPGLFEGTKVEAVANRLSKMFSSIHKIDAEHTKPEHANEVADRVADEIDQIAKTHDKEAYDAIKRAETSEVPTTPPGAEPTIPGAGPTATGATPEPTAVAPVGGGAEAEGARGGPATEPTFPGEPGTTTGGKPTGPNAEQTARAAERDPNKRFGPGKSDLVDKAGNIRLDLLNTTADIDKVLKDTANENDNFTQERRGVISNGMTLDLADALGMDPSMLDTRKIGEAFSAEKIVAAVKLLVQSAKEVNEAAKNGDVEKYAEVRERHKMIQGHVSGITAEAGRALQIFQSFKKIEGYDQAKAMSQFLKENDNGKTLNQLEEEMAYAAKLDRPQQVSKFIQDSASKKFKDQILEYYVNCLISGPITHMRYAVGNAVNALWRPLVEIPSAAGLGKLREIATGEAQDRVYIGEAKAQLYAMGKGARDGISAAIEAFQKNQSPALPGERVSAQFLDVKPNAIPGVAGQIIGVPGRSVAAIHSFFKSLRYEQNIAGLAYRQAMKEGLEGGNFEGRVAQLTKSPTEEMMQSATEDALKELYMAPTEYHSAMGALVRFTNQNTLAKIIMPFMKIGSQITGNAFLDRTPLGVFNKEIRGNLLGANGPVARDMQAGKITAGIALIGATTLMVSEGMATGDGPTDPKERAIWLLNHRPNSMTVGNLTIPYQGLGSLGMLMRFSANMMETAHAWDGEDGSKLAVAGLEGVTKAVLDENFMRGVKDLLDAVYHPDEYGARYLQGFVTNWLPFSVGQSQIARQVDPYQREVISHGWSNAFGIIDEAKSKVPFLSETLEPRRDRFGQPIKNGGNDIYANDPVVKRMEDLQIGIGRVERKIRGVNLTDQQYDDFSRLAGTITKMRLNALVTPAFSTQPQQAQVAGIDKVIGQSRELARKLVMLHNPEIYKAANEAKAIKKYGKPVSSQGTTE